MSQHHGSHVGEWASLLGERVADDAVDRAEEGRLDPDRRVDGPEPPTGQ